MKLETVLFVSLAMNPTQQIHAELILAQLANEPTTYYES
jgi:hypothetical protein